MDSPVPASSDGREAEVLWERRGSAAIAILNRPKALNALNLNMVDSLQKLYEEWETDSSIVTIVLKGAGRAFCAGGDVRAVYDLGKQGRAGECTHFFRREYELNYVVSTLRKPHVAILDGLVMGGGNGISMHGPFRVATEKTVFAMPETAIGLHPDVGASYFLPRLPGHVGEFLALTGYRLRAPDMHRLGLATHVVPSSRLPLLEERLCALRIPDLESVEMAIREHAERPHAFELDIASRLPVIDFCFGQATVEEIFGALFFMANAARAVPPPAETPPTAPQDGSAEGSSRVQGGAEEAVAAAEEAVAAAEAEAEEREEEEEIITLAAEDAMFAASVLETLARMSPTSLKVALRSVREGRQQTLAECLEKELRLSARIMEQTISPDYYEGIRALLVDKDNEPKWSPERLEEVTEAMVEEHFRPFPDRKQELHLPLMKRERFHSRPRL